MKKRAFTQNEKAWGGYSTHSLPGTRTAENLPDYVEDKVKEFKGKGYEEDYAWPMAWSIYCKHKEPNSPHCHQKNYLTKQAGAVKDAIMDLLDPFQDDFIKLSPEHADDIYDALMSNDLNTARSLAKANSALLKKVNEAIHALQKFDMQHSGKDMEHAFAKYEAQFQELSPKHWEDIRDSLFSLQSQPDPHLGVKMTPELKKLYQRAQSDIAKTIKHASEETSSYDGIYMSLQNLQIIQKASTHLLGMLNHGSSLENWVESKINRAANDLQDVPNYLSYNQSMPKVAGWAGGGFSNTLDDFALESGQGSKLVAQGRIDEIRGWDKYAMLVAEAYKAAPKATGPGKASVSALVDHIVKMFQRINAVVEVKFVDYDPYKSAEDMQKKVKETGVLEISTLYNQSDSWSPEVNLMFRTLHDFTSHLGSNPKKVAWSHFTAKGELIAYNKHLALLGKDARAIPAIFTEIVGQAMYFHHYGDFPDQKAIILSDFDPIKLGSVKGYNIVDGDLV